MSIRRYTAEQLHQLRASPLVKKPEDLPAIEQWLEFVYLDKDSREKLRIPHSDPQDKQKTKVQRTTNNNNGDASPMGNFSTGQRPSLLQTRSHVSKHGGEFERVLEC